jgi:hypothetical protein
MRRDSVLHQRARCSQAPGTLRDKRPFEVALIGVMTIDGDEGVETLSHHRHQHEPDSATRVPAGMTGHGMPSIIIK